MRDVPVYGDVILSPMAGFSDLPYRSLCYDYGSAMSYTEFVSARAIVQGKRVNKRTLQMLASTHPTKSRLPSRFLATAWRCFSKRPRRSNRWGRLLSI